MKNKLLNITSITLLTFGLLFANISNTYAYIDPSVVTYTWQIVAGIAVALGAALGIYLRKAKKKVSKVLNIDENKNKEVESDEIVVKEK